MEGRAQAEKVLVRGRIEHETSAAVLMNVELNVVGQAMRVKHWFPLSQVHSIHRTYAKLGYDTLHVTYWIAKQKGIV